MNIYGALFARRENKYTTRIVSALIVAPSKKAAARALKRYLIKKERFSEKRADFEIQKNLRLGALKKVDDIVIFARRPRQRRADPPVVYLGGGGGEGKQPLRRWGGR